MTPLDKLQTALLNYKSADVLWVERASQRLREIEREERANALRAPGSRASHSAASRLRRSGFDPLSQGEDK